MDRIKKLLLKSLILFVLVILVTLGTILSLGRVQSEIYKKNIKKNSGLLQQFEVAKRLLQTTAVTALTSRTGITLTNSSITKFNGLIIYQELPLNWTVGQIFQMRGKLTNIAGTNGTYVSFTFINTLNSQQCYYFQTFVPQGQSEWTLNIDTRSIKVGDYYLAFYSGPSGFYSTSPVYKLRSPGVQNNIVTVPLAPTECILLFADNKLLLKWNQDEKTPIEKIIFSQTGKTPVQYILSNFQSSFTIPHKDFSNFSHENVTVTLSSAYSSSNSVSGKISQYSLPWTFTFRAGHHVFSEVKTGVTFSTTLPWIVPVGTTIILQGSNSVKIENTMYVQEPQLTIGQYPLTSLTSQYIAADTTFNKSLNLQKQGVYILEINQITGFAIINRPVYVGDFLPLIPDFVDSTIQRSNNDIIAAQPQTLDELRNALLTFINQKRTVWGRSLLVFEPELNNIAQAHSNDMITRNFIGHINPDGDGPQQRAIKAGITYGVGENIAYNLDLAQAHERLCRSPGHLDNIVDSDFARIGLGIARDSQGYLYITQNFAAPEVFVPAPSSLTLLIQVESVRVQVRDWMLTSYSTIKQDTVLTDAIRSWQASTNPNIFDYIWNITKYPASSMASIQYKASYSAKYTSKFIKGKSFSPPDDTFTTFGISATSKTNGSIEAIAVYAK